MPKLAPNSIPSLVPRLFTDFDGPIMDVSERYFRVYQFCLEKIKTPNQAITALSKTEFWELKRAKFLEAEIALKSGLNLPNQPQNFAKLRAETIHSQPFFEYDCLNIGAVSALETAQNFGIDLAIITMRRERELLPVLEKYDLQRFFPADRIFCLPDNYQKTQDIKDKPKLMTMAVSRLPNVARQWIVGDTEADITAGKNHDIDTIGVLSGIRNQAQLTKYQPQMIVANLEEAVKIIINAEL